MADIHSYILLVDINTYYRQERLSNIRFSDPEEKINFIMFLGLCHICQSFCKNSDTDTCPVVGANGLGIKAKS